MLVLHVSSIVSPEQGAGKLGNNKDFGQNQFHRSISYHLDELLGENVLATLAVLVVPKSGLTIASVIEALVRFRPTLHLYTFY